MCDLKHISVILSNTCIVLVDTRWKMRVAIVPGSNVTFVNCTEHHLTRHFTGGGIYNIYVSKKNGSIVCNGPLLMNDVPDSNIPIYVTLGSFTGLAVLWILVKKFYGSRAAFQIVYTVKAGRYRILDPNISAERDLGRTTSVVDDDEEQPLLNPKPIKERLKSLDTFRGISIVIMIFVNYGGGSYWFFSHSKWNGLTVADLVFPWFIFIMGTSMAFSFTAQLRKGSSKSYIFLRVLRRSALLFAFGLIINGDHPIMDKFRIPGVLQRFAFTYVLTASMHLYYCSAGDPNKHKSWAPVRDIFNFWQEWIINGIYIMLYLVFTFLLDVPMCPTGYLGPGGAARDAGNESVMSCTGGAAGYIDRQIFTEPHIYQGPTCEEVYDTTVPYDPEGLFGTFTSCFLCFLGLQAGKILRTFPGHIQRVRRFGIWAIVTGCIALVLCKASKNDGWIPINKNLWSLSFVLALAGMAFLLLSFCYVTIDVYNIWTGAPFYYPGMNSIALYMGHEIMSGRFPVAWEVPSMHAFLLPLNIWGTTVWVLLAWFLHYKGVFLSV